MQAFRLAIFAALAATLVASSLATATPSQTNALLGWSTDSCLDNVVSTSFGVWQAPIPVLSAAVAEDRTVVIFLQNNFNAQTLSLRATNTLATVEKLFAAAVSSTFAPATIPTTQNEVVAALTSASSSTPLVVSADDDNLASASFGDARVVIVKVPSGSAAALDIAVSQVLDAVSGPVASFIVGVTGEERYRRAEATTASRAPLNAVPSNIPYVANHIQQRHEVALQWFNFPVLMGVIFLFIGVGGVLVGVSGLGATKTPEKWADAHTDKCLEVPQN